jgi:ParB/RepB/Spo0J family partition protein
MEKTKAGQTPAAPPKQGRADRFKQRPKLDPVADLEKFGYVGQRKDESEVPEQESLPPWFHQFKLAPIDTIRPGPYQVRMVKDPEKDEQLRAQIREDLENHETVQHVFVVVEDQEDSRYYNPKMGGHRRLEIAKEEGVQNVYIWVQDYNQEELARGTYAENDRGARQELTIVEEGELFRRVQQTLGWTQTEIAEHFHVVGGQPHVARCIQAASYPEDIKSMLLKDPERGMRAAHILAQLDEAFGPEKAIAVRAPLIKAFEGKTLPTDALQLQVDHLLGKHHLREKIPISGGLPLSPPDPLSEEQLLRLERATTVQKSFVRYQKTAGNASPSTDERAVMADVISAYVTWLGETLPLSDACEELREVHQQIGALLARK